ncbi:MAG: dihydroneopterin aldolase [Gammaproteobacteria bacterium]
MDTTFINDLRVETVIGVHDWERKIRQTLSVDVEMACDTAAAAKTDNLDKAIDYSAVCERLLAVATDSECQLLETLAETLCHTIMDEFNVAWMRLRLNKRAAIKQAGGVGIIIERGVQGKT